MRSHAETLLASGRDAFRFDTFGDEVFWGDTLQLHRTIAGAANGGIGAGVSPQNVTAAATFRLPAAISLNAVPLHGVTLGVAVGDGGGVGVTGVPLGLGVGLAHPPAGRSETWTVSKKTPVPSVPPCTISLPPAKPPEGAAALTTTGLPKVQLLPAML